MGLHDGQPAVSDFVDAVFQQMKEEKSEITFGFNEIVAKANPETIQAILAGMNPEFS